MALEEPHRTPQIQLSSSSFACHLHEAQSWAVPLTRNGLPAEHCGESLDNRGRSAGKANLAPSFHHPWVEQH